MKTDKIKEILQAIAASGLDEVNIETESLKLHVKRNSSTTYVESVVSKPVEVFSLPTAPASPVVSEIAESKKTEKATLVEAPAKNTVAVKSPMIGTFYRSSSPDSPVFVNVGDVIQKGKVVCIIEAMKLFNEIESEVSGRVVKVLVENASPVEYDQELFLVEPI